MGDWIINFYHTELMHKAGIISFSQTRRNCSREAVYNEALVSSFENLREEDLVY